MQNFKNISFEEWLELPKDIWGNITKEEKNLFAKLSFISINGKEEEINNLYEAYINDIDSLISNPNYKNMKDIATRIMKSVNDKTLLNDFPYNTKNYISSHNFVVKKDYSELTKDEWLKVTSVEWSNMGKEDKIYFAKTFFTFHESEDYASEMYKALLEDVEYLMSLKPEKIEKEENIAYIKMAKVIEVIIDSLYPIENAEENKDMITVHKTKDAFDKYFNSCTNNCSTCGGCH